MDRLHRSKPDRDNIDKAVLDVLFAGSTGGDSGIARGTVEKRWADKACLYVSVWYGSERSE